MIEYLKSGDIALFQKATSRQQVNEAVAGLVARMPAPRVFVATPAAKSKAREAQRVAAEHAFITTVQTLVRAGHSVIDPSLIATLLTYSKTWDPGPMDEQSLFLHLAAKGHVDHLYLPDDWARNARHGMMRGIAQARHLDINYYTVPCP